MYIKKKGSEKDNIPAYLVIITDTQRMNAVVIKGGLHIHTKTCRHVPGRRKKQKEAGNSAYKNRYVYAVKWNNTPFFYSLTCKFLCNRI